MRRISFALLMAAAVASSGWTGDTPKPSADAQQFLQQLQVKLDHAAARANQPGTGGSSVVGVRGAEKKSGSDLYWANPKNKKPVAPEELKSFRDAVALALNGKPDDATQALKDFKEKYPKSPLVPDVDTALQKLAPVEKPAP